MSLRLAARVWVRVEDLGRGKGLARGMDRVRDLDQVMEAVWALAAGTVTSVKGLWFFRAHSLKSLERNILWFSGIGPIRETLIGRVEASDDAARKKWLAKMRDLGGKGQ